MEVVDEPQPANLEPEDQPVDPVVEEDETGDEPEVEPAVEE